MGCVPCLAVQSYNFVVGMSGYYIVRFELARLAGQEAVTSATVHFGNHGGQSLPAKQQAKVDRLLSLLFLPTFIESQGAHMMSIIRPFQADTP